MCGCGLVGRGAGWRLCPRGLRFLVSVMVMTAALVVGLWALAGEAFTGFFQDSMNKVRNAG